MKKFLLIPLIFIGLAGLFLFSCLNRQIDVIKFPEPSGAVIGIIERDFDGNGHDRYLTLEQFKAIDPEKINVRKIILESSENAVSWAQELERKNALLVSFEYVDHLIARTFGYTHDDIPEYEDNYKDYNYEVPKKDPPVKI